jgi:hypothetical protein
MTICSFRFEIAEKKFRNNILLTFTISGTLLQRNKDTKRKKIDTNAQKERIIDTNAQKERIIDTKTQKERMIDTKPHKQKERTLLLILFISKLGRK